MAEERETTGCERCNGFCERVPIKVPRQYYDLLKQIRETIAEGTMRLVEGTCDLDEIANHKPWPSDIITHKFACSRCDRHFELCVDTYHGGGSWGPT